MRRCHGAGERHRWGLHLSVLHRRLGPRCCHRTRCPRRCRCVALVISPCFCHLLFFYPRLPLGNTSINQILAKPNGVPTSLCFIDASGRAAAIEQGLVALAVAGVSPSPTRVLERAHHGSMHCFPFERVHCCQPPPRPRAAASLVLDTCQGGGSLDVDVTVEALATAWASTLILWIVDCETDPGTSACAVADAEVRTEARAFADSFVDVVLDTPSECGCVVDGELAASLLTDVVVRASVSISREFCAEGALPFVPLHYAHFTSLRFCLCSFAGVLSSPAGLPARLMPLRLCQWGLLRPRRASRTGVQGGASSLQATAPAPLP